MSELDMDIKECVDRARERDQDAAQALVHYLSPFVRSIVRSKLPRGAAEEDLVQEILAKVFERLGQYRGQVPLHHWVSRIAVNHALNALRSQRARPEWRMADLPAGQELALESESLAADQLQPGQDLASRELVETILETLNPEDRLLIRKLDLEEFSIADIQQVTGWSAAYIRLRAFRARQKLNRRFARASGPEVRGARGAPRAKAQANRRRSPIIIQKPLSHE